MSDAPLAGAGALITGGGSGIGLGCAQALARDGASVTICGRTESRLLEAVEQIDGDAHWIVCDVVDEEQVARACAVAAEPTGTLSIVVASAGGSSGMGPIATLSVDAWRATLDLNLTGTFLALKHAAPRMVAAGGGSFVAVSSIAAVRSHRFFGAYGPAKAGIEALVEMGADELGPSKVRVNAVRPGLVDTELVGAITAGGPVLEDYMAQMPLARVGTVDDIAAAVRFLAGPESTWITGHVIAVDGGHGLRRGPDFTAFMEPAFGADALRGAIS